MKNGRTLVILVVAILIVALSTVAVGQDKATAQEVIAKVREAASTLSKTGDSEVLAGASHRYFPQRLHPVLN